MASRRRSPFATSFPETSSIYPQEDMIPGDVRILSAKDLFVSQGTLTGESLPVEKFQDADPDAANSPAELKNTCFMAPAFKAAQRPQSSLLQEFAPISAQWRVPSRRKERRQASTRA